VQGEAWNEALLKSYFEIVLEAFRPECLTFGMDSSVCLPYST